MEQEQQFSEFFNQKLRERGLSLKQLSDMSGIALKHLENFSYGSFENLPPSPYLHGYFERLGEILGFDPEEWWARVRKEDLVPRSGSRDKMPDNPYHKTKGRVLIGLGVILLLGIAYFGIRSAKILGEPQLTIAYPPDNLTTSNNEITVQGTLRNGDSLAIHGENVPLESNGAFQKDVLLYPGPNQIDLTAKKLLGRQSAKTLTVYYNPPEAP